VDYGVAAAPGSERAYRPAAAVRARVCRFSPVVSDAVLMTCGFIHSLTTCRTLESHVRVESSTVRGERLRTPVL
jgi:hypothetical protein